MIWAPDVYPIPPCLNPLNPTQTTFYTLLQLKHSKCCHLHKTETYPRCWADRNRWSSVQGTASRWRKLRKVWYRQSLAGGIRWWRWGMSPDPWQQCTRASKFLWKSRISSESWQKRVRRCSSLPRVCCAKLQLLGRVTMPLDIVTSLKLGYNNPRVVTSPEPEVIILLRHNGHNGCSLVTSIEDPVHRYRVNQLIISW